MAPKVEQLLEMTDLITLIPLLSPAGFAMRSDRSIRASTWAKFIGARSL
jgi:hypothetical protein